MTPKNLRFFVRLTSKGIPAAGSPVLVRKSKPKDGFYLELTDFCCAPVSTTTTTTSSTTTSTTTVAPTP